MVKHHANRARTPTQSRQWYHALVLRIIPQSKRWAFRAAGTLQNISRYQPLSHQRLRQILRFMREYYQKNRFFPNLMEVNHHISFVERSKIPVIVPPVAGALSRVVPFGKWREFTRFQREVDREIDARYAQSVGEMGRVVLKNNWKNWTQRFASRTRRLPTQEEALRFVRVLELFIRRNPQPAQWTPVAFTRFKQARKRRGSA